MVSIAEHLEHTHRAEAERVARLAERTAVTRKSFRGSMGWRRVRYAVLAENSASHGGKATCELCGTSEGQMHVDHILPISTAAGWEHRLDKRGLRVACADCNVGRLATPIAAEGWTLDENMERKKLTDI